MIPIYDNQTAKKSWDFARFWSKVEISSPNNCWEWKAGTFKERGGYGQFSIQLKPEYAHRVAWIMVHGSIPNGLCVLHHCDNPLCVNPHHLFLGNRNDNNQDMIQKGRQFHSQSPGEANGMSKLSEEKIREIRTLYKEGVSQYVIAKRFGVRQSTISRIILQKTWKHII